ncbi:hypothetical protein GCM10027569_76090 [Flindersiella endophytica]
MLRIQPGQDGDHPGPLHVVGRVIAFSMSLARRTGALRLNVAARLDDPAVADPDEVDATDTVLFAVAPLQ